MTHHILMKMLDGQKHIIIRGKNKRSPIKKKKKSKKQTEAPLQLRVLNSWSRLVNLEIDY